jgi:hypothetical protein
MNCQSLTALDCHNDRYTTAADRHVMLENPESRESSHSPSARQD